MGKFDEAPLEMARLRIYLLLVSCDGTIRGSPIPTVHRFLIRIHQSAVPMCRSFPC